jgi:glutaredoxin 2
MKLYMRWQCRYCIRVMLQAALTPHEVDLVVLSLEDCKALYNKYKLSPFLPALKLNDGSVMQESEDIISYLQSLQGTKKPLAPVYDADMTKYLRELMVDLRFAIQYYYKIHYKNSILCRAKISPFPGSAIDAVQAKCDELDKIIIKRFDDVVNLTINGISSDDFYIFADLTLLYELREYAHFTFKPAVKAYMSEIMRLCSHLGGFKNYTVELNPSL